MTVEEIRLLKELRAKEDYENGLREKARWEREEQERKYRHNDMLHKSKWWPIAFKYNPNHAFALAEELYNAYEEGRRTGNEEGYRNATTNWDGFK